MLKKNALVTVLVLMLSLLIVACEGEIVAEPVEEETAEEEAMDEEMADEEMAEEEAMDEEMNDEEMAEEEMAEPLTIAETAAADEQFSILVAALDAAGLVETFADPEADFTVFAPTNAAFEVALTNLGISADDLLADTELLTSILTYHVVAGSAPAEAIIGADVPLFYTLEGSPIQANVVDGGVLLNRSINVVAADVQASNGVIHVIDAVLLPPAIETEAEANIVEIATEVGAFNTLLAAAVEAGLAEALSGEGPFTVFAPTDDAFAAYLEANELTADDLLADPVALRNILLYHVALGALRSGDVVGQESILMINGDVLAVSDIPLTETLDVEASNGIIHVIDGVLIPPMAEEMVEEETPGTIAEIAAGDEQFSTLVAALDAAGLVETVADPEGEFTVFAPTNAAFEAALAELGITAEDLLASEDLSNILLYHVVAGAVPAETVVTLEAATTVQGSDVTITVTDAGEVFLNDTVQVIVTDVEASNGIIHVLDGVLLPPAEEAPAEEPAAEEAPVEEAAPLIEESGYSY